MNIYVPLHVIYQIKDTDSPVQIKLLVKRRADSVSQR